MSYILPGVGGQMSGDSSSPNQSSPLLHYYSPRLFGAPPQLTHLNDMRLKSSDGTHPGPVGDFYLTNILQDAQIATFTVGRARFMGGMSSLSNVIKEAYNYYTALSNYDIFDTNGTSISSHGNTSSVEMVVKGENLKDAYKTSYGNRDNESTATGLSARIKAAITGNDIDSDTTTLDISQLDGAEGLLDQLGSLLSGQYASGFVASLMTSLSVQQPFYTFEKNWNGYINNVKMMINTAVIMLGLQNACVRIGDMYYPIGMNVNVNKENDVWANYRYITPTTGLGSVTAVDTQNGDDSQNVSFMITPTGLSETISNATGQSQLFSSVIDSGSSMGREIAFISNANVGSDTDKVINLATESKLAAENVLKNLSSGSGRFTAAIAGSMARSYVGDHTIYPEIYQSSSATSSMSMTIHLSSDAGDPYSYLCNELVPLFFILGMALPELSRNNASAYTFPPLIQCNIPGIWGTRLGIIESVQIQKNSGSNKDVSINGYPLSIDVTITVKDLQHVLVTSPMNKISTFLNNHTMFDYIAQMSGVDRYRPNGSMRVVARLALASSALNNTFVNIGNAIMTDWHSLANKLSGFSLQ